MAAEKILTLNDWKNFCLGYSIFGAVVLIPAFVLPLWAALI